MYVPSLQRKGTRASEARSQGMLGMLGNVPEANHYPPSHRLCHSERSEEPPPFVERKGARGMHHGNHGSHITGGCG